VSFPQVAAKEGDSEMIQQILFTIFRLLQHRKSREVVCQIPAIHDLIITCIGWPHPLVRTYANSCMDVILEHPVTQLKEELMKYVTTRDFGDIELKFHRNLQSLKHNIEKICYHCSLTHNALSFVCLCFV